MPARRAGRSRLASNGVEVHIDPFWHEENGYSGPHAGEAFPGRKKEAENVPVKAVGRRWAYTRQDFRRAVNVKPAGAGSQLHKAPGSPPLVGMPWILAAVPLELSGWQRRTDPFPALDVGTGSRFCTEQRGLSQEAAAPCSGGVFGSG